LSTQLHVPNLQLLSIPGLPGINGLMGSCPPDDTPLDIKIVDYIQNIYYHNNDITLPELSDPLRKLYKMCKRTFPSGFKITYPRSERGFVFEPNPHENCVMCTEDDGPRCLLERQVGKRSCPEYGLTVVMSTDPDDFNYTLITNDERKHSNIHMNSSAKHHWLRKINPTYKNLFNDMITEKHILLSDLVDIFIKGLGFTHIDIIDPTCRACEGSRFKKAAFAVLEQRQKPISSISDIIPYKRPRTPRLGDQSAVPLQETESTFGKYALVGLSALAVVAAIGMSYLSGKKSKRKNGKDKKSKQRSKNKKK
jgi:hypothetical protein